MQVDIGIQLIESLQCLPNTPSSLEGRIDRIRFLTSDVAILTAYGHIVYNDDRSSDNNKRTIYTLTAQKTDATWTFVAYQNTPLGGH